MPDRTAPHPSTLDSQLDTTRVRGKWVAISLAVVMAITAVVYLSIQLTGRSVRETNFVLLSYTAGLRDLEQGFYTDAVKNFTPVVESGTEPAASGWRGEAYRRLGQYAEAEADFRRAIELEPDVPANHAALGDALAAQGKLDEAVRHLDRAIELLRQPGAPRPGSVRRWGDSLQDVMERRAEVAQSLAAKGVP